MKPVEKIYYIPTNKKIMCLTFDDGPNNPVTTIILNILKSYNIKATFFVLIENVINNPKIIEKIISDKHEIALHGYNHSSFNKYPKRKIYHEIKKSFDLLQQRFGITVKYFRPPYGTTPDGSEEVMKEFNIIPVGWTIMEKDWKPGFTSYKSQKIITRCSPGKIIVMHDGFRSWKHEGTTVENVKQIIPPLLSQGYSFVTIQELISARSKTLPKIYNNIPLLGYEVLDLLNQTTLFFYWDINSIDHYQKCRCPTCNTLFTGSMFKFKVNNINVPPFTAKYPSPYAMEDWAQQMDFPLHSINKNTDIFIQDKIIKKFIKI